MMASWLLLTALAAIAKAQSGLTVQVFQIAGSSEVNNAKLAWNIINSTATSFEVQRKGSESGATDWQSIANITGNTHDDYDLKVGGQYTYRVASLEGTTNEVVAIPFEESDSWNEYDNTQPSNATLKSQISLDGVYYQYNYITTSDTSFYIQQQTSQDGYTFSGDTDVLSSETICASITNHTCHLERLSFLQHPDTKDVVMWAHLENIEDYSLAQVACASGQPGHNLSFCGTYRPLGHDSRDLTFWADDAASGNTAYLISATDVNSNMNIYQLTSNWTAIDNLAAEILIKQYREAPAMAKVGSTYYLFSSRAAGWYPSMPQYVTSESVTTGWTAPFVPGDASTYAAQSGGVVNVGNSSVMFADRWAANWSPQAPPNLRLMLPLSYSEQDGLGYADFHYFPTVKYNDAIDNAPTQAFGVQNGRVLSIGRALTTSPSGGSDINAANDGVSNDNDAYFLPASVPFTLQVDLGNSSKISQVDWHTHMVQGSETYYQYTISASANGSEYTQIGSEATNTAVGFVSTLIDNDAEFRYVNVSVTKVVNTHNLNEADTFRGVLEFTVYGQ